MSAEFAPEQKRFLEGFASGLSTARAARGLAPLGGAGTGAASEPTGPDAPHLKAQAAAEAAGGKLVEQETWKRAEHPFDARSRLKAQARENAPPKPEDNFRWRYHGLFHVAPAQNSYMCRLRIPNGILRADQFAGVAELAERTGGPYLHVTTRANLQFREIPPARALEVLEGLSDLGLTARGSGADNIRNVTGSATAGIDPREIADTRPLAREWHHHVLNERTLFGLPRKFNVAFDGGGAIATLEDTNDVGFQAVRLARAPHEVRWRLALGGITGHRDLARDTGVLLRAEELTPVADAIVRVFIETGDRTNRAKARLKYVLDRVGFDPFLALVEARLGRPLARAPASAVEPRPPVDRSAHLGVHAQSQAGLNWIGVAMPAGRLTTAQTRALAEVSRAMGDGEVRLTVWQNLLISGVPDARVADAVAAVRACGLDVDAKPLAAGLVACTGATGCKFAAAHTKEDGLAIAAHVDARLALDRPVNVHVTGCHNSCAQHYIGDIGLIGARVPIGEEGDTAPGYDVAVGGGYADRAAIGRLVFEGVRAEDAKFRVEALLRAWLAHRLDAAEPFSAFANRHEPDALRALAAAAEAQP